MKCLYLRSKFDDVISSDECSVYKGYPFTAQQKCRLHLRRHFKTVVNLGYGNNSERGQVFWDLMGKAFAQHGQWRLSKNEGAFRVWIDGFKFYLKPSLHRWTVQTEYEAGRLMYSPHDKILHRWYLFEYLEVPSVTNWAACEACRFVHCVSLCLAVTKQQALRRSRSSSMNRFAQTADLLSVVQTCRRQGRLVLEFFQKVLMAKAGDEKPLPSPLPELCT